MSWGVPGVNPRVGRLGIAMAIGILILGVVQLRSAKVDFLPEFMPPSVQVQTEALGLSAAEVEQLVTVPLEQDLLNGVPWLDRIHSRSQPGLSAIDIVFEPGTDIYAARQMVQERLTQAHALPNVGSPPIMVEPLASVSRVAMIGLKSTTVPLIDMSVLARWKVRPKLMGVPGVANVSIYGLRDRQLQVQVDPEQLKSKDVTLTQVIETTGNALWVSPLTFVEASTPGTGGFVEGSNQRLAVQHVLPITTAESLGQVSIEGTQTPTKLADVTQVIEDHQPLIGDAVSTEPTLFLVIQKFPEADTGAVTKAVEEAMASLEPGLGGIDVDTSVYRPATFIDNARYAVGLAGGLGLVVLLLAALLLFWSWRAALVIGSGVVVTTVTTLYLLYLAGTTLTTMTLAGLVAALTLVIGVLAGDIDSVRLGLRSSTTAEPPTPVGEVIGEVLGRTQRTAAVVFLVGALTMAPVLVLDPVSTAFSKPMAMAFVLALVVAMAVGLVLTPALLVVVLRGRRPAAREVAPLRWLTNGFGYLSVRFATARTLVWAGVGVLVVGALAAVPQLSTRSFVPAARDVNLLMHVDTQQGTSLTEMNRVIGLLSKDVRDIAGVSSVGAHVGRAVTSDQLGDVNAGEVWITLDDSTDYAKARANIEQAAARYPGIRTDLLTYSSDRIAEVESAAGHDVVVRVFGQDFEALQKTADRVTDAMSSVTDVRQAHVVPIAMQPTIKVEVDLPAAQHYGLRPGDVRREATTLASGLTVGNLYEQAKVFDVVVLGGPNARHDLTALEGIKIDTPSGEQVRLGDVAKVSVGTEPASIVHNAVMRSVDVVADISGRDAHAVVADVQAAVGSVPMPSEAHLQVLSPAADQQADQRRLTIVSLAALIGIILILQAATGRWRHAAALVLLAPLGAVGAVLLAPIAGGLGSAGPLLAAFSATILTLLGGLTFARGSYASTTDSPRQALAEAARSRAVPVTRAALLIALAFLPAVVLGNRSGSELVWPYATTLLGGLVSSVFVVLCLVPALCGLQKEADR